LDFLVNVLTLGY